MLKFIGNLFSKALWGSVFGFVKQYAQIIVAVLLIAFGMHYSNLRNNHKTLKADYKELQANNNTLISEKIQLHEEIFRVREQFLKDSLEFQKRVVEFQTLIQQLQARNKATETKLKEKDRYVSELESGLICKTIKVNWLGKKTVTVGKCEDED